MVTLYRIRVTISKITKKIHHKTQQLACNERAVFKTHVMKAFAGLVLTAAMSLLHNEVPDNIKMNRIQVIGSHNSYKKAIDPALFKMFQQRDSVSASKIDYEHISITEQLDMGLRNLEIDVYGDEKGGKYAHP